MKLLVRLGYYKSIGEIIRRAIMEYLERHHPDIMAFAPSTFSERRGKEIVIDVVDVDDEDSG